MKKYELDSSRKIFLGNSQHIYFVHRIRALKDFADVRARDYGGYVTSKDNLSQYGNCWIYDSAVIIDNAFVSDNAIIRHKAIVKDKAIVKNQAIIQGHATISKNVTNPRSQGCPRFQSKEELANSVGKINAYYSL